MKNHFALLILAAFSITGSAIADIQSPPGHHYTWSGKLTRGVGNIAFAPGEYITRWRMALKDRGPVAGLTEGLVEGTHRSIVRLFYGVYEVATCPVPSWKQTYRPPYPSRETVDNWWGYTDFVNENGQLTHTRYSRTQGW